jgi:simple sugar transport system ATP-binding protein
MTDFATEITNRRPPALPEHALGLEVLSMTKRFGAFTALDQVSLKVPAGSFHALLGENGAASRRGQMHHGYYHPTRASHRGDRQQVIENVFCARPRAGHGLSAFHLGHGHDGDRELVLALEPACRHRLRRRGATRSLLDRMPFRLPLDAKNRHLRRRAAEMRDPKQLYLKRRFLILMS